MLMDMIWIAVLIGIGLLLGYTTLQSVEKRDAKAGNPLARVFNYLAAGIVAMVAPTVLCNVFVIQPEFLGSIAPLGIDLTELVHALLIAFIMIGIAIALLVPYAVLEKPRLDELAQREDRGWTREDAESSGL